MKQQVRTYYLLIIIGLLALTTYSCKSGKEVVKRKERRTENKRTKFILDQLTKNEFKPETISFKASTKVKNGEKSSSFKATVKIKRDSIIWVSITSLGYEAARILMTPDTLLMISRLEKKFYAGNQDFLRKKFQINLSFNDLQAVLLGNSIGLTELEKVKKRQNKHYYYLSSVSQRKLRKAKEKPKKVDEDVVYGHWLDPLTFRIIKLSILDLRMNQSAMIDYSNFESFDEKLLPGQVSMKLTTSGALMEIDSEYYKVEVNKKLSFPFKISKKYEPFY